jgi:hypothetical protein
MFNNVKNTVASIALVAGVIGYSISPAPAAPVSSQMFNSMYNAMMSTAKQFGHYPQIKCQNGNCERQTVMPFGYVNNQTGYVLIDDLLDKDKKTVLFSMICRFPADMTVRICDMPDTVRWEEVKNPATGNFERDGVSLKCLRSDRKPMPARAAGMHERSRAIKERPK